ncbi:phosphoenolpyruvate--protein phosphotransferase [Wukongibacter sp. M2B1]|uniref:phosphoenolpyruvate--protein phosphotransferase n=1 Tax=Wukongibacter sp. M2B1 TaxID=3088895 RepID=UPI003D7AF2A1
MTGIGASSGIAYGKVFKLLEEDYEISKISKDEAQDEILKLKNAVLKAKEQIKELIEIALDQLGEKESEIFNAHYMILEDPEFMDSIINGINKERYTAEYAVKEASEEIINVFSDMDNAYMKERASDIKDVSDRIIKNILGIKIKDLSLIDEQVIIVAEDLTPSDTVMIDRSLVLGFITKIGGVTSHSAIMARTMGLPAVVGVGEDIDRIKDSEFIIMDGDTGDIIINPNTEEMDIAKNILQMEEKNRELLKSFKGRPSETKDSHRIELACNIGSPNDIDAVIENDGEGIGLFRSEFLYMNHEDLPSEDEQFEAYKRVLTAMEGRPVIIRTLDVGGDKELPYLNLEREMNPFLGCRAVRLCLREVEIFRTQLRALLRASLYGNLKIMFPMISSYKEIIEVKEQLNIAKQELLDRGEGFSEDIKIGIMIEIPSAALISDILAKEVDFFSIGTNDLVQYTTAVDRINQNVSYLYSHFHPAVLRLMKTVAKNANNEGTWVGICGEAAGDIRLLPFLVGIGLNELSVSSSKVLKIRSELKKLSYIDCKNVVESVLTMNSAEKIQEYLEKIMEY